MKGFPYRKRFVQGGGYGRTDRDEFQNPRLLKDIEAHSILSWSDICDYQYIDDEPHVCVNKGIFYASKAQSGPSAAAGAVEPGVHPQWTDYWNVFSSGGGGGGGPVTWVDLPPEFAGGTPGQIFTRFDNSIPGSPAAGWQDPVGAEPYVHIQTAAASVWNINHDLNFQYVSVDIIDNTGSIAYSDIDFLDADNVRLTFSMPVSGRAIIRR